MIFERINLPITNTIEGMTYLFNILLLFDFVLNFEIKIMFYGLSVLRMGQRKKTISTLITF